nr:hypothetical protein [Spirosoma profusum]
MEKFSRETGQRVDFADITIEVYHRLKSWMTERGLTLNYVGTLL